MLWYKSIQVFRYLKVLYSKVYIDRVWQQLGQIFTQQGDGDPVAAASKIEIRWRESHATMADVEADLVITGPGPPVLASRVFTLTGAASIGAAAAGVGAGASVMVD